MKFKSSISDVAQAAGVKLLMANDVHLSFLDREGRKRGFYRSTHGWVEAEKTGLGWRATMRSGLGPLFERPVIGMSRGATLDAAATGARDVFPSATAVIRATMPAVDVEPSRLARWFGL